MVAPPSTLKVTKKQKKSLAFRDRKSGKQPPTSTSKHAAEFDVDDNSIPLMEDQDLADLEGDRVEVAGDAGEKGDKVGGKKGGNGDKGKGKQKAAVRADEAGGAVPMGKGKSKKRKRDEDEAEAEAEEGVSKLDGQQPAKKKTTTKEGGEGDRAQRLILFVGNLAYTTAKEAILKHFSTVCDPPPVVRLLTPKARPGVMVRQKSKGCAFLEFKTKGPLQEALKLHQSILESRMINVELTAGGGGKSEARLNKVRERNKELLTQRTKKVEVAEKSKKVTTIPSRPDRPQRYSATSGLAQAPLEKRTWTVGDIVEEETHRGGKNKQRGKRKPAARSAGTGVNAIPIG